MESTKREDAATTTREGYGVKESEMNNKSMWNNEAVKAYESGQGVVLVEKPYPHYVPLEDTLLTHTKFSMSLQQSVALGENHEI